jgi:hypothetical protein
VQRLLGVSGPLPKRFVLPMSPVLPLSFPVSSTRVAALGARAGRHVCWLACWLWLCRLCVKCTRQQVQDHRQEHLLGVA